MSSLSNGPITVLDPRGRPDVGEIEVHRLPAMQGRTVGFLWNNRPRGDIILRGVAARLEETMSTKTVFASKLRVGTGAPIDEIRRLEKQVEAVIVGVGD